jgi:hypothetical protein
MIDDELLEAWDDLNGAIGRVLTSQPDRLSQSVASLEVLRERFRTLIQKAAITTKETT